MDSVHLPMDGNGNLYVLSCPGCYPLIYWVEDERETFPLCGECAQEYLDGKMGTDPKFIAVESGSDYEHNLPCDNCGRQLAAYYDEEEEEEFK